MDKKPAKTTTLKKPIVKVAQKASTKKSVQTELAPIDKLLMLKKKQTETEEEMKQIKIQLINDLLDAPKRTLKNENGTITLNLSNNWSLPPINVTAAQELLKESFLDYFKPKTTYGVEPITKTLVNTLTANGQMTEQNKQLAEELTKLIEIKQTESWTIKPN